MDSGFFAQRHKLLLRDKFTSLYKAEVDLVSSNTPIFMPLCKLCMLNYIIHVNGHVYKCFFF